MSPWEELCRSFKLIVVVLVAALLLSVVIGLEAQHSWFLDWYKH